MRFPFPLNEEVTIDQNNLQDLRKVLYGVLNGKFFTLTVNSVNCVTGERSDIAPYYRECLYVPSSLPEAIQCYEDKVVLHMQISQIGYTFEATKYEDKPSQIEIYRPGIILTQYNAGYDFLLWSFTHITDGAPPVKLPEGVHTINLEAL